MDDIVTTPSLTSTSNGERGGAGLLGGGGGDNGSSETSGADVYIEITVSEPQKVGDGMGSYIAYKVTTSSNLHKFRRQHFYVLRRFSDFLGLHDILVANYLRYGRIIPPAPQKNIIGTTKAKIAGQSSSNQQSPSDPMPMSASGGGGSGQIGLEWVENRRAALERFLNRTAQHPVLRVDPAFVNFLESETDLPRAVNTSTLSGAGVLRMFNMVRERRIIGMGWVFISRRGGVTVCEF